MDLAWIFAAGTLTLATPCVLPLLPIYLAILTGGVSDSDDSDDRSRSLIGRLDLLLSTAIFSSGFIVVFTVLGLTATSLGSLLTEHRTDLVLLGSLLIFLFGLKFLGLLKIGWLERDRRLDDRKLKTRFRRLNALVMGVVFALGWTPCVGPILGSVLTFTASSTTDPLTGAAYLAIYGLGFALPLLVLSLFADGARRVVRKLSPWLPKLEKATGLLLVVVGLALMLGANRPPAASSAPGAATAAKVTIQPPLGQATTRPRMVEFVSSSCTVCRQMIPTVALVERDCGGRQVDVIKVDVDQPQNRQLAQNFRVRGVPTFVFLDRQGSQTSRMVGYQSLGALRQALATLVGERCDGVGLLDTGERGSSCQPQPGQTMARCKTKQAF